MNVICISDKWEPAPEAANDPRPQIGDIDTVIKELTDCIHGRFYELERFPEIYYHVNMFATLPDTPAEVIEEEETEFATA